LHNLTRISEMIARDLAANLLKFQRSLHEADPGFHICAGDLFPETEQYAVRHFSEIGHCLRKR